LNRKPPRYKLDDEGYVVPVHPVSWWDRHWLKVAIVVLFLYTSLGFYKLEGERTNREESVNAVLTASCYRNNNLRAGLRQYFKIQIIQAENTDPKLFPSIPPEVFRELVAKQIHQLEVDINERFARIKCTLVVPGNQTKVVKQGSSE
jgi:hypothetical protein